MAIIHTLSIVNEKKKSPHNEACNILNGLLKKKVFWEASEIHIIFLNSGKTPKSD